MIANGKRMVMFGYHTIAILTTDFQSQINYTHCYSAFFNKYL